MKPADHPEFYRLPPPAGFNRQSSIRLDAHGFFWHDGERITRPSMAQAFARWLARHPDNHRFILQNGYDWVYVTVEDTPYFVSGIEASPSGLRLYLTDDSREHLGPRLLAGDDGALYSPVKAGRELAKWSPSAQRQLEPFVAERNGEVGVEHGAQWTVVTSRANWAPPEMSRPEAP